MLTNVEGVINHHIMQDMFMCSRKPHVSFIYLNIIVIECKELCFYVKFKNKKKTKLCF